MKERIESPDEIVLQGVAQPHGDYPHARVFNDLLFLSGVGPREADSRSFSPTFDGQCRKVMENVDAVLRYAKDKLLGVVAVELIEVMVYLTDLSKRSDVERAFGSWAREDIPILSTVEVAALPGGILIEMKVRARLVRRKAVNRHLEGLVFVAAGPSDSASSPQVFGSQCTSVFENLSKKLDRVGIAMSDVLDVEVNIVDSHMKDQDDWSAYNRAYHEVFGPPRPARTTIGVRALPYDWAIQAKVAAKPRTKTVSDGSD